ncbi:MAG TPA: dTMP kinase [Planctomycetaceae bacterium]|nr:dTMP kinase [Planctomycetaceae bacterium]
MSLDGVDGAGKSTQIELLKAHLESSGKSVSVFRDPGGTRLGDAVREILLHRQEIPLAMTTEMLLYMSSRAQLVEELIRPALESGRHVISDRYLLANVVYQGHAGGLSPETIRSVGEIATGGLVPDLTLVLDLDPAIAHRRLGSKLDRLESRGLDYMNRVREGFRSEAQGNDAIQIVDADRSVEEIHHQICDVIGRFC